jgi:hypothetical protein
MAVRTDAGIAARYAEFNQGQRADAAATTDVGTFSLISLFKRLLVKLTTWMAGAANVATGTATAGVASGVLVAARATRRKISVSNTHATDAAWIGPGVVSAANGYSLPAGQQVVFETVAALNCLRSAGNNITLSFVEVYD